MPIIPAQNNRQIANHRMSKSQSILVLILWKNVKKKKKKKYTLFVISRGIYSKNLYFNQILSFEISYYRIF